MPTNERQAIRNALSHLGIHFPPKGVVATLAQKRIEVDEELVREVRFQMLLECTGQKVAKLSKPAMSPAVKRHPKELPMSKREEVDPRELRQVPIRHKSLPPELLGQIRAVFDVLGPYLGMTLEQFEIGFMRGVHPESDVALWCGIAKAWLAYHEDFLGNLTLPVEEERTLLGALIGIASGIEDLEKFSVPVEIRRRLIQCYENPSEH
jgi:hypothetical protein